MEKQIMAFILAMVNNMALLYKATMKFCDNQAMPMAATMDHIINYVKGGWAVDATFFLFTHVIVETFCASTIWHGVLFGVTHMW
jgi:hypothetical protein